MNETAGCRSDDPAGPDCRLDDLAGDLDQVENDADALFAGRRRAWNPEDRGYAGAAKNPFRISLCQANSHCGYPLD